MLIRRDQSHRTTCLVIGGIVAITMLLACIIVGIALWIYSIPDQEPGEQASTAVPTRAVPSGEALISILDVDQGQAVLIVSPDGSAALIDAGRSQARIREEIVPYARQLGVTELQYLILSHPDQDHVGGIPAVLEAFTVENWVDPGIPTTNQTYEESVEIVLDQDIPAIMAQQGEVLPLGDTVSLSLLWPQSEFIMDGDEANSNENSVVVAVSFGDVDVLIPGDLETAGEEMIVSQYAEALQSEVLVVGHHGSNTSSTAGFLDAVDPEVAIISAGEDNPYGHPHDEVLQRLRFRSIDIYQTDQDGTIEIRTDGTGYTIETVETDTGV